MNQAMIYVSLAVVTGSLIPFQTSMYAQLGKSLHSPFYATFVVFLIAALFSGLFIVFSRAQVPAMSLVGAAPTWSYLGGVVGSLYVVMVTMLTPRLGIGNTIVLVLLGNILAAIVIDQFGWLGAAVHTINPYRLLGVILIVAGVYLTKKF